MNRKWKCRLLLSLGICLAWGRGMAAEGEVPTTFWTGLMRYPAWQRPLWADMHSTLNRAETALAVNSPEYDWAGTGQTYRPYVFANLGVDFPIWSGELAGGRNALAVSIPFFVDVWLDMFERTTAPVINTAYRFGAPEVAWLYRLRNPRWGVRNIALRLSPMKHECTHIGDELVLMREQAGLPIRRVNVSYNYAELALTLNDPENRLERNHCLRMGLLLLHNRKTGWYSILPQEGAVEKVVPAASRYEWYVQYQYQSKPFGRSFQAIASVEVRNRVKYHYPLYLGGEGAWQEVAMPDYRTLAFNAVIGVRYTNPLFSGYFSKVGAGIRAYQGVNPYGQFRSQPYFQQLGLCLFFE